MSCKHLWRKLVAQPGTRSRHPASTTASHGTRSPLAADAPLAAHQPLTTDTPLAAHQPLTAHTPLAQRAIEDVLLSSDLLQTILAILVAGLHWWEHPGKISALTGNPTRPAKTNEDQARPGMVDGRQGRRRGPGGSGWR